MGNEKKIIVTASNEAFAALLFDLIESLEQFSNSLADKIGVLDLGLSDGSKTKLLARNIDVVSPVWDIDVSAEVRASKPYLRAMTARPFLPRYFPGYDIYLWLDADTWVQDKSAIKWLFAAAFDGSMALVPEMHPSYRITQGTLNWKLDRLGACYRRDFTRFLHLRNYFNTGVFAMKSNAPHWKFWADSFAEGVNNCESQFVSDQTALNYAIWKNSLKTHPLPATCNWCCHLSLPAYNKFSGRFCEPHLPHRELGIIHMTANAKDASILIKSGEALAPLSASVT